MKKYVLLMIISFFLSDHCEAAKEQEKKDCVPIKKKLRRSFSYNSYTRIFFIPLKMNSPERFNALLKCFRQIKNQKIQDQGAWNGLIKVDERFILEDGSSIPIGSYAQKLRQLVSILTPFQIGDLREIGLSMNGHRFVPFSNTDYERYLKKKEAREVQKKENFEISHEIPDQARELGVSLCPSIQSNFCVGPSSGVLESQGVRDESLKNPIITKRTKNIILKSNSLDPMVECPEESK